MTPSPRLDQFLKRKQTAGHTPGAVPARRRPVLRIAAAALILAVSLGVGASAMAKGADDFRPACERTVAAEIQKEQDSGVTPPAFGERDKRVAECIDAAEAKYKKGIWTGVGIVLFAVGYIYGQIQVGLALSRAAERREKERREREEAERRRRNPNEPPKPPGQGDGAAGNGGAGDDGKTPPNNPPNNPPRPNGWDDEDDDDWGKPPATPPKAPPQSRRITGPGLGRAA